MRHYAETLELATTADTDIVDLSAELAACVERSGVERGWALVFTPGSTAAVTTLEFESGCVEDLRRALEEIAPRNGRYAHNERWGDGNGYSHLRSALVGPSLTLPVRDGRPVHGTWQQVVLCDFDNRPRQRRVEIEVMGAAAGD